MGLIDDERGGERARGCALKERPEQRRRPARGVAKRPHPRLHGLPGLEPLLDPADERRHRALVEVHRGHPLARVLDFERPAFIGARDHERCARHHPRGLLGVGVHGEVPARAVEEELEQRDAKRRVVEAHVGDDGAEDGASHPLPGLALEPHVLGADLERIAHRGVDQRRLTPPVGRGHGERFEPREVGFARRAGEGEAPHRDGGGRLAGGAGCGARFAAGSAALAPARGAR